MAKVIYNGRIRCAQAGSSKAVFREAIIVDGGRIVKTGSSGDLLREVSGTGAEKIDAEGALVVPAFNDSHLHLMWVGRRAGGIECAGAASIEEVVRRGREHIARHRPPAGTYLQGYGVNPDTFAEGEKRDLRREDVDKISREHPVILGRHCGHTSYCNSPALELAGFGDKAPEVQGGAFEKDENGRPTGVVRENAKMLLRGSMPVHSREDMKGFIRLATQKAHSLGISACGSYDSNGPEFDDIVAAYREVCDESREAGAPALRVSMQCGISGREDMLDARLKAGPSGTPLWEDPVWGKFLQIGAVKIFGDGTLGGQTAWMSEPYLDKPETRGYPLLDNAAFTRFVEKAAKGGMQVLVHAIGDACIDNVVCAYEKVLVDGKNPLRHGIIHCQFTTPDLLERIARGGILAMVQPIFLAEDIRVIESRVGARLASTSYAWGSMARLGIRASYSTDAPVGALNPLECMQWAMVRRDSENPGPWPGGFYPGERVDAETAFEAYTTASAFSAFAENSLGRIAPGYLADLAFLDRDIFAVPPEELHKARVLRTVCAGETVYLA